MISMPDYKCTLYALRVLIPSRLRFAVPNKMEFRLDIDENNKIIILTLYSCTV